jgi:hypothetical protein
VQRVADHQPHARERRVQPVDGGLALLEVVQVHPAPLDPVHPDDGPVALQFVSLTPAA